MHVHTHTHTHTRTHARTHTHAYTHTHTHTHTHTWRHHLSLICWMRLRSISHINNPSRTRERPCSKGREERDYKGTCTYSLSVSRSLSLSLSSPSLSPSPPPSPSIFTLFLSPHHSLVSCFRQELQSNLIHRSDQNLCEQASHFRRWTHSGIPPETHTCTCNKQSYVHAHTHLYRGNSGGSFMLGWWYVTCKNCNMLE